MSNYIFTVRDQPPYTALDKLKIRQKQGRYGLKESCRQRKAITPGDRIIFYLAGQSRMAFAASAIATSGVDQYEEDAIVPGDEYYTVQLKDFVIWPRFKPVQQFLGRVAFIRKTDNLSQLRKYHILSRFIFTTSRRGLFV